MYNFSNNFRLIIVEETSDIIEGFVVFKCPSTPRLIVNKPTKSQQSTVHLASLRHVTTFFSILVQFPVLCFA